MYLASVAGSSVLPTRFSQLGSVALQGWMQLFLCGARAKAPLPLTEQPQVSRKLGPQPALKRSSKPSCLVLWIQGPDLIWRLPVPPHYNALNDIIKRPLAGFHIPLTLEPTVLCRSEGIQPDGDSLMIASRKSGHFLAWDAMYPDTLSYPTSHKPQWSQELLPPLQN